MSTIEPKGTKIQVITRATSILKALGHASSGMTLGQIAVRCNLPRSTVQRIVNTLLGEGYVLYLGENQGYTLGPEIQALASASKIDVWRSVHPHLVALAHETGETVDLAVLQGDVMLFVDQVAGRHRLRAVSEPGERLSARSTANGKACLSLYSDDELCDQFDPDEPLLAEVTEIRTTKIAYDRNGHTPGISAVGAAFSGHDGQKYAVSIPVPSQRFESIEQKLAGALLKCLDAIKAQILGAN